MKKNIKKKVKKTIPKKKRQLPSNKEWWFVDGLEGPSLILGTGTRPVVPSTEICPYCHKPFDDDNGGCCLAHEHGRHPLKRGHHPTYAELEAENRRLRSVLSELMTLDSKRPLDTVYWRQWWEKALAKASRLLRGAPEEKKDPRP
jgi:hypothetical protein